MEIQPHSPLRILALIPAHDEEAAIGSVVRRALPFVAEVWVVADGCADRTAEAAAAAGARVLVPGPGPLRRGKAAALRHGWDHLGADPSWTHLALLDGDGQHDPEAIPLLAEAAASGGAELVLGRRVLGKRMPLPRRWTNRALSFLLSRRLGRPVADSQCGFRLLSREFLATRRWKSSGFEIESEMLFHAAARGWRVAEVPVATLYKDERSKIDPWSDGWRWLRFFVRPSSART